MDQPTDFLRQIQGFPGYFVSSAGQVFSNRIKGRKTGAGPLKAVSIYRRPYGARYCVVCLRHPDTGKVHCLYVHALVLEAFVGRCPEGMECCHEDGDTGNNHVGNLRWGTHQSNMADKKKHGTQTRGSGHPGAKLTEAEVAEIRASRGKVGQRELARRFNTTQGNVSAIHLGKTWR
jgi:hypothetical protein